MPPAKVLVAGAGVAGLAAIGAASSLGAIVRATDPRPEVADQVRSLGGEYLAVDVAQEESTDGYARATSADYDRAAARLYQEQARDVDVVITTALIPGRPAPRLMTAADVAAMRPGSVIVDMAAAQGGNVEGTVPGRSVVTGNGVTIIGYTDLASRLPAQASQLFGTNLVNLLRLLTPGKDGRGRHRLRRRGAADRDRGPRGHGHREVPPAGPRVGGPARHRARGVHRRTGDREDVRHHPGWCFGLIGLGMLATFLLVAFAPAQLAQNFTVFALAVVIGYYVIGKVHHSLHTPLMSVTNAISGIVVIGALVQIGHESALVTVLSFVAILLTSVNIFGGFAVTRRMLSMFSRGEPR
ncbi:NAD(P) transhydrogenase subunit alpha [Streptomyces tendae]